MENIRQPTSFQDRIIQTFLSDENSEYLYNLLYYNLIKMYYSPNNAQRALTTFISDMIAFSSSRNGIYSILNSDNLLERTQYGLNIWDEVKRLNVIFYQNKMNNYINTAYAPTLNRIAPAHYNKVLDHIPIDGAVEDNDDYAMKMFISDSLQPEGYEYLNNMGPKYELLENQHKWGNKKNKYDMGGNDSTIDNLDNEDNFDVTLAMALTAPVNPNAQSRTAEDAIMEVMGENYVSSETALKHSNTIGSDNSSFMRYKEIPFWQHLPREGVDTDIDETLGFGMIETGNHVRGWDMSSLREKNNKKF